MGFVARLRRGTRIINLNASPFTVGADFVPPGVAETPQIAEGRKRARRTGEARSTQSLSVSIHVEGTTVGSIRANVDNINLFLRRAGRADEATYFEWRPDNLVAAETILGQGGAYRSVEVLWGEMQYGGQYGWWDRSQVVPDCSLNLVAGPAIDGKRQLLAQAMGGITEDWIGKADGASRGVILPPPDAANGNYFTNPIFSNSTWNDGWTAGAGCTAAKNIDQNYVLFGTVSARLTSTSSTTGHYTCSIDVGDTNAHRLSCYARRPDGTAITSGFAQMRYNGNLLTTTFTAVGNGWYRLSADVTGVASAVTAGILVKGVTTLYVDGFQLEKRAFDTPLMCGDFLGHAWTIAGHGSRSTRTAPYVRYPVAGLIDNHWFSMRIEWTAPHANTVWSASHYIFKSSAVANFQLSWDGANNRWSFMTTYGATTSFAAGDRYVFHVLCTPDTLYLYINGVLYATETTVSILTPTSGYLYIGSDDTPANHTGGTYGGLHLWNGLLTAAEVLADYNNILPILTAGGTVSPLGYIWTKDGDSVVDYTFSGDGSYSNIAVIGGVPGSIPAKIEFKGTVAGMNNPDVYIGNLDVDYPRFINPEYLVYEGSPDAKTVNTSDSDIATLSIDDDEFLTLAGKKFCVLVRGDEDGSDDISLRTGVNPGGAYYYTDYEPSDWIASSTSVSSDASPTQRILDDEELYRLLSITRAVSIKVQGKRPTGTATFNLHSAQILPLPLIRLVNTSGAGIAPVILYIDGKAYEVNSAALSYTYSVKGNKREFGIQPGKYNLLVSSIGAEGVATDTGDTLTYNAFYVTPRWAVL